MFINANHIQLMIHYIVLGTLSTKDFCNGVFNFEFFFSCITFCNDSFRNREGAFLEAALGVILGSVHLFEQLCNVI